MNGWRLCRLETHNAYRNMALDEAILHARIDGKVLNTVRLYSWMPSAVSIGRFQSLEKEVNIENCKREGVDMVRRITGGGAVYHDFQGEVTYSVIAEKKSLGSNDVAHIYRKIGCGIIEAAKILRVNADFNVGNLRQCPNITVDGKKISGNAQFYRGDVVLQHGTLLLDVDIEKMFDFLRAPHCSVSEIVGKAEQKITSFRKKLREVVSKKRAEEALIEGFKRTLKIEFAEVKLTPFELKLADELAREKYCSKRWNFDGKNRVK